MPDLAALTKRPTQQMGHVLPILTRLQLILPTDSGYMHSLRFAIHALDIKEIMNPVHYILATHLDQNLPNPSDTLK